MQLQCSRCLGNSIGFGCVWTLQPLLEIGAVGTCCRSDTRICFDHRSGLDSYFEQSWFEMQR
jgi:hypothetical protein